MGSGCFRRDRVFFMLVGGLALLIALVLSLSNVWLGSLNQDEGWYLMAARLVHGGALPYRDFAFTQGPVMPVVYALLTPLIERGGLLAARLATVLLGWLTAVTAAALAARLVPPRHRRAAVCLTWTLVSINVYHAYFMAIVKTYALSGLLLMAGFYLLCGARAQPSRWRLIVAAAALMFAAGARISLVAVLPVLWLGLWLERRAWPAAWLWFGIGGLAAALLVFLPFAAVAPEGLWFGMVEYHAGRSPGGFAAAMVLKAGFVSRVVQAYFVAVAAGLALLADQLCFDRAGAANRACRPAIPAALLKAAAGSLALVTFVHALSPFPYDDYQVVLYAPVCALLAAAIVRRIGDGDDDASRMRFVVLLFLAVATFASFASPINQDWFISGRDRIWWRVKPQSDLRTLRMAANRISALYDDATTGRELLTQDPYLAIEAGCTMPLVMAMGPFSYFPDMTTERARRLRVMNRELLIDTLRHSQAPVAAFSGYGLSIAAPSITELPADERALLQQTLLERYALVDTISDFGQAHTELEIYRRRQE